MALTSTSFGDALGLGLPLEWLVFFFVFAAIFGLLTSVGKSSGLSFFKHSGVNVILSIVFGLFATGYTPFLNFFAANFGVVLWSFVGLFVLSLFLEVLGLRKLGGAENAPLNMIIAGLMILLLVSVVIGYFSNIEIPIIGTRNALMGLLLLFVLQMFFLAYKIGPTPPAPPKK